MFFIGSGMIHKAVLILLAILILMLPLAGCGEDEEKGPVKVGAVTSWSGPSGMAGFLADDVMALVKDQVEERGGILGGRSIEFVKHDDRGQVADVIAGWRKLAQQDVSAVVFGGGTTAAIEASSDEAERFEIPLFNFAPVPRDLSEKSYTVRCSYSKTALTGMVHDFLLDQIKPKTVALLCEEDQSMREFVKLFKDQMDAAGIDVIYEQYVPFGTTDFAPYLVRIKHDEPDVLIGYFSQMTYFTAVFKQITDIGGWGDITFISPTASSASSTILKLPGAQGTYHWVLWVPDLLRPAAQEFQNDFLAKYGNLPSPPHVFFYLSLWGAVNAIEMAGSDDPKEIAEVARSGKLTWETPAGPITILPDGETELEGQMTVVQEEAFHSVEY